MRTWHRPAHTCDRHAETPTAHGTCTLLREPGPRPTADGVPFTARASGSSPWPSRRGIRLALDDGRTPSFTVHRFHQQLVRSGGEDEVRARTRTGRREADRLDRDEPALLRLVTVTGLERLLASPLQEL